MADTKLDMLRRVPLFSGLDRRGLEEIERLTDEVDVPAGRVLMREGETANEFFLIVEGRALVDRDGKEIASLGPGDFLGEIGLIDGGPRTATVTIQDPMRAVVIARREFHTLLDRFPDIRLRVLEALAQRIRRAERDAPH